MVKADNAVMRDPVLFRIIEEKHYTLADKYRITIYFLRITKIKSRI